MEPHEQIHANAYVGHVADARRLFEEKIKAFNALPESKRITKISAFDDLRKNLIDRVFNLLEMESKARQAFHLDHWAEQLSRATLAGIVAETESYRDLAMGATLALNQVFYDKVNNLAMLHLPANERPPQAIDEASAKVALNQIVKYYKDTLAGSLERQFNEFILDIPSP